MPMQNPHNPGTHYADPVDITCGTKIHADSEWAASVLERLTMVENAKALKPEKVAKCQALAFVQGSKGGLGISVATGRGFIIAKVKEGADKTFWSSPVFFSVTQVGVGMSLGVQDLESVILLSKPPAVKRFCHHQVGLGVDIGTFTAGTQGANAGIAPGAYGLEDNDVNTDNEHGYESYTLSDGLLVNASINGMYTEPDREYNSKVYGAGNWEAPFLESVLDGKVPPLAQMHTLYNKAAELLAAAHVKQ